MGSQRVGHDWVTFTSLHFTSPHLTALWRVLAMLFIIVVVQSLHHVQLFVTPMDCRTPGSPALRYLLEFAQIHVHWVSDAIWLSHPLPPPSYFWLQPFSQYQGFFQWVGSLYQALWSFSFSISPSNEYLGLISFRIDWFGLLAVQGTLKSLLQHHSSKALILWCSALKPSLENFEDYFASMWDECNCAIVWVFFHITFLWNWNENWPFPVLWPLLSFPYLLAYWVKHFNSIIFYDVK